MFIGKKIYIVYFCACDKIDRFVVDSPLNFFHTRGGVVRRDRDTPF